MHIDGSETCADFVSSVAADLMLVKIERCRRRLLRSVSMQSLFLAYFILCLKTNGSQSLKSTSNFDFLKRHLEQAR
ncbi:hypothetical protein T4D_15255 [Trichinella pseudospiralis]|uniref:Uncharacterized protein n=1 Tax=Trichinella pseudospiralis TaxID=6337 RepID=A0A0V1G688_TRIPS|nr:hypothetical protein T4D_15255 [Trichinella pseudospiralis]